ncbi:MAG: DeoR family transcriptional regulator [Firmicutes bacterium]|nr:DeoR family transcriptional regulator [Bacillota bacterium]
MDGFSALQQLVPELAELLERRYSLLRIIRNQGPIGRRFIAGQLGISERIIRGELDVLREQGLLRTSSLGMELTPEGEQVFVELQSVVRDAYALEQLENRLAPVLGVKKLIVVPGDCDKDPATKRDLARTAAEYLCEVLRDGQIVAVSGGTTLASMAEYVKLQGIKRKVTVVPVRGGLGEDIKIQSNSIAVALAEGLGGTYRLLHAPEDVRPCNLEQILSEPSIRSVIALGRRADILLHGIGTAEEMARRRGFDDASIMDLIASGAVGETFGCYFDAEGRIVRNTASVGLRLEDLERIPLVIAVGGGRSKAWAVMAVLSRGYCDVCITDEGVARRLMSLKEIE